MIEYVNYKTLHMGVKIANLSGGDQIPEKMRGAI